MKVSLDAVDYVARLCRLSLTEEERERFTTQLNQILAYVAKLNELDTENIEPTSHVVPLKNVLREDKVIPSIGTANATANAPDKTEGFFKVPRIIE